jgi:hypothetical protein
MNHGNKNVMDHKGPPYLIELSLRLIEPEAYVAKYPKIGSKSLLNEKSLPLTVYSIPNGEDNLNEWSKNSMDNDSIHAQRRTMKNSTCRCLNKYLRSTL